jgi:hypothetical protein
MHIILDVDGTLVDGDGYNVWPRSHLKEFIAFCFDYFDSVSIWTAASSDWYHLVYQKVLKDMIPEGKTFLFVFTGNRCVNVTDYDAIESGEFYPRTIAIKPLIKVWHKYKTLNRNNTLILDDTRTTYERNYGNAIPISTFVHGDETYDSELSKLIKWIKEEKFNQMLTVRKKEKRFWSFHDEQKE